MRKYIGLHLQDNREEYEQKMTDTVEAYKNTDLVLGVREYDDSISKIFEDNFRDFSDDLVLLAEFPERREGLGAGSLDFNLIKFQVDIDIPVYLTVSFYFINKYGPKLINKIKDFLKRLKNKINETFIIKLRDENGNEIILKLPKYLNINQIDTAIETIYKDKDQIKKKVYCRLIYDTESKKFKEE